MNIHQAASPQDFAVFANLIKEYVNWCRHRFADRPGFVEDIFDVQSLEVELQNLPLKYSLPAGRAFLARGNDDASGCIAYRRLSSGICEMKRLFVVGSAHGQGIGRQLCTAAIAQARADGFSHMRLDTLRLFTESVGLYRSLGFLEREPYLDYPPEILAEVLFMELRL